MKIKIIKRKLDEDMQVADWQKGKISLKGRKKPPPPQTRKIVNGLGAKHPSKPPYPSHYGELGGGQASALLESRLSALRGEASEIKRMIFDFIKNFDFPQGETTYERLVLLDNFESFSDLEEFKFTINFTNRVSASGKYRGGYTENKKIIIFINLPKDFIDGEREKYFEKLNYHLERVIKHEIVHFLQYSKDYSTKSGTLGGKYGKGLKKPYGKVKYQNIFKNQFYDKNDIKKFKYFTDAYEIGAWTKNIYDYHYKTQKTIYNSVLNFLKIFYTFKNKELEIKVVLTLMEYFKERYPIVFAKDPQAEEDLAKLKKSAEDYDAEQQDNYDNIGKLRY
jgi:hypothetical protein